MVEIADITDRESLETWLESQPRRFSEILAHRAAMVVLPVYWESLLAKSGVPRSSINFLPSLWSSLVSGTIAFHPSSEISAALRGAASYSTRAISAAGISGNDKGGYAGDATGYAATYSSSYSVADAVRNAGKVIDCVIIAVGSDIWGYIRADCRLLFEGKDLSHQKLWLHSNSGLFEMWLDVKEHMLSDDVDWNFWVRWYEASMEGEPMNWVMSKRIALIAPKDWERGPLHVNGLVAEIEAEFDPSKVVAASDADISHSIEELLGATLFDFTFDQLANVMRAIPMPEDWKHLDDEERLRSFIGDATDARESFELLSRALQAESRGMQGAGAVSTYLDAVLSELDKADNVGSLNVGKLLEYGGLLERMSLDENLHAEFGVLNAALEQSVKNLKELSRKHFSNTLARFTVLRDLEMEEDLDAWEVLRVFRDIVSEVESGGGGKLPALAKTDVAVLSDVLDSVERLLRSIDESSNENSKSSMRREVNFQLAKIGATTGIYKEKAEKAVEKTGDGADKTLKWFKRFKGIGQLGDFLKDMWDKL